MRGLPSRRPCARGGCALGSRWIFAVPPLSTLVIVRPNSATDSSLVRQQGGRMSAKQSEGVSYSVRAAVGVVLGAVVMMATAPQVAAADADEAGPQPSRPAASAPILE